MDIPHKLGSQLCKNLKGRVAPEYLYDPTQRRATFLLPKAWNPQGDGVSYDGFNGGMILRQGGLLNSAICGLETMLY